MDKKNKSRIGRFFLGVAAVCLILAGAAVLLSARRAPVDEGRALLSERLPMTIGGWIGQDLPLGDSEVQAASDRILNYDDYIYRVYRKEAIEVFVYAMYWRQGSISVREIAGHTPDACWVANGAKPMGEKREHTYFLDGQQTAPAELRQFMFARDHSVSALWWHIWGENLVDESFDRKSIGPTLKELWVWLFRRRGVRRDQLLVRIHSPEPADKFVDYAPVTSFLKMFPQILTAKPL